MKRFLTDSLAVGASHVVAAIVLIAVQVFLARYLPLGTFGMLLLAQACVNLLEAVFVARSGEVALHWVGRTWSDDARVARAYARFLERREIYWNLGMYGVLVVLTWPIYVILEVDPLLIVVLGLSIPFQSGYGVAKSVFVSSGRLRLQSAFEIAWCISFFLIVVAFTWLFGAYGFAWGSVTAIALKTVGGRWLADRIWPVRSEAVDSLAPPTMWLSTHSIARNLSSNIATQADVLILGAVASKETVAIYRVAKTLANLPSRIAGPLWSVLRPRLLKCIRNNDVRQLRRLASLAGFAFLLIGMAVSPVLWLESQSLVVGLYGQTYEASVGPFLLLFAGMWAYGAVTGWLGFVAVVSERKVLTTMLFALLALLIVGGGFAFGSSAIQMATVVASSMVFVSALAWLALLHPVFLVGRRSSSERNIGQVLLPNNRTDHA